MINLEPDTETLAGNIGQSSPLGATVTDGGVNFSLYSRTATGVELLLFNDVDDSAPAQVVPIDPSSGRTYHYWHAFVPDIHPGQLYGYRVSGPWAPQRGLRFDLASILSRDANGYPIPNPPVLWDIESDPDLADTKLLAEAWDAAGLYQVGSFVGDSWREWNGRFRDDVRDLFRCEPGSARRIADRIVGSPEIYGHKGREVEQSVNFVTCHDGFTINDLVSLNDKHNGANGEGNRDGASDNRSWNCGAEGQTDDPQIERLRNRQVKNFLTVTMLSLGVPMIAMGDEVRRTQHGNINAYCQDNEISWFDWSLLEKHADVLRFVRLLTARRVLRTTEHERRRVSLVQLLAEANESWHGVKLNQPDWNEESCSLAQLRSEGLHFHLILNAYREPLEFELAHLDTGPWRRWIDTALDSPDDIVPWDSTPAIPTDTYLAESHSVVMLIAGGLAT
ncbi:MAG: hypothetical protein KDA90_09880 [Planctomycetaceae bacterium]|nr:hypothetical protein [Planctomycetaceae bacterium]